MNESKETLALSRCLRCIWTCTGTLSPLSSYRISGVTQRHICENLDKAQEVHSVLSLQSFEAAYRVPGLPPIPSRPPLPARFAAGSLGLSAPGSARPASRGGHPARAPRCGATIVTCRGGSGRHLRDGDARPATLGHRPRAAVRLWRCVLIRLTLLRPPEPRHAGGARRPGGPRAGSVLGPGPLPAADASQ